jgi:septin family protein
MATQQSLEQSRQNPNIRFRILIIGRANAGKTSILQRVCETTWSAKIYRGHGWGRKEVRGLTFLSASPNLTTADQVILDPSVDVSDSSVSLWLPLNMASEGSTASTTNSCSPITKVTFFTTHAESNRVAQRNSKSCKDSFNASVENGDCETDCMRYGLDSPVFTITTTDHHISKVLCPNGQPTTTA